MTNYEKIKAMSVEEMAKALCDYYNIDYCVNCPAFNTEGKYTECAIKWLESEADEND